MASTDKPKQVLIYADADGHEPFTQWLTKLRDTVGQKRIFARLRRLEQGNLGDCKPLGEGVYKLRLFFSPGYRVYFGEDGHTIVIILCGGDKSTQNQDIETAKTYWRDYLSNASTQNP